MKALIITLLLSVATTAVAYDYEFDARMEAMRQQQQENYLRAQQIEMQAQQIRQQNEIQNLEAQQIDQNSRARSYNQAPRQRDDGVLRYGD